MVYQRNIKVLVRHSVSQFFFLKSIKYFFVISAFQRAVSFIKLIFCLFKSFIYMENQFSSQGIINLEKDLSLRKKAEKYIPGGMWGHMSVKKLPYGYPQFFSKAKDARIWDLDGNCYIDFMCGYGPNILGYNNIEVDQAVDDQRRKLDLGNGPSALVVDLAEKITTLVDGADWALFAKHLDEANTIGVDRCHNHVFNYIKSCNG